MMPVRRKPWFRRSGLILLTLVAITPVASGLYHWAATQRFESKHPAPGVLHDVGGHRLHIHRRGHGSPTVVIDAGLSGASYDWEDVATRISAFTQVCTYDRAGYGWSDPGPRPRTSRAAVEELRTLLGKDGVNSPIILLGHSWAGLNARLFASDHPDEIAGLVLVDALSTDLEPDSAPIGQVSFFHTLLNWTACLGTTRLVIPGIITEPSNDADAHAFRVSMLVRTKSSQAIHDELAGQTDWRSVRSALKHLGDKPVVVLTTAMEPTYRTVAETEGRRRWRKAQEAMVGISRNSKLVVAVSTRHDLQFHEPDLIVATVRSMVEGLRLPE